MSQWLRDLQALWVNRIEEAKEAKKALFGDQAETLWDYFSKDYRSLYVASSSAPSVLYGARINKFQEFVDLYMPFVLAQTPVRRVSVRRPQFPEEILQQPIAVPLPVTTPMAAWDRQARSQLETAAILLEWWLQFSAEEYQLLREARLAVQEALIKGRGLLWHGVIETSVGVTPASFFESVDNLLIDPTVTTLRDAGYIIRKRKLASWQAAEQLGVDEKKLLDICRRDRDEEAEEYSDVPVVEYYEVYSRIGLGSRLAEPDDPLREWQDALDAQGAYVWLAIGTEAEYPLNLHPEIIQGDEDRLKAAVQWPVATYGKTINPWPMSVLDFYPHSNSPWARSPLEPGRPMQTILDHLYSLIFSQARRSASTIIAVPTHADENFVSALKSGDDLSVVRVNMHQITDLAKELYAVIAMPPVSRDLWEIFQEIEQQFGRAVGLDPFLYGSQPPTQPRSAAEVEIRYKAASGRAMAMAERVEDWLSQAASKDGTLTRLYVGWAQMAPLFWEPPISTPQGPIMSGPLSAIWAQIVSTPDPVQASADFHFSVVAGSGRRKDKQQQSDAAQMIAQTVLPVALQIGAKTGDYTQYNRVLEKLSNAMDMDMAMFRIEQAPPQEEQPNAQQQPTPGEENP